MQSPFKRMLSLKHISKNQVILLSPINANVTGYDKSKMAADKPELLIYKFV